jgi:hypothetical protein
MKLTRALKEKNRLAGELTRLQKILQRENSRRNDSTSTVDRAEVWDSCIGLTDQLSEIKGKICVANIGIYPKLERMSELKSRIAFIKMLSTRNGEEIERYGRSDEKIVYQWDAFLKEALIDDLVSVYQTQINDLQDEVDDYNATTDI